VPPNNPLLRPRLGLIHERQPLDNGLVADGLEAGQRHRTHSKPDALRALPLGCHPFRGR